MTDPSAAIDPIRALLPVGSGLAAPLLWLCGALVAGALTAWVGMCAALGPLRCLEPDAHWVERARLAYPPRMVSAITSLVPFVAVAVASMHAVGPVSVLPARALAVLAGVAGWMGSALVRTDLGRGIRARGTTFLDELVGELVGWLLLIPHLALAGVLLLVLRPEPDLRDGLAIAAGLGLFGLLSWRGGIPLLSALGMAAPAPAGLRAHVEAVAARLGIVPRAVWVVRWHHANALALPLCRHLVYTDRILAVLDDGAGSRAALREAERRASPRQRQRCGWVEQARQSLAACAPALRSAGP